MKKNLFMVIAAALAVLVPASCNKEENRVLEIPEQQEKIESILNEFAVENPAEGFEQIITAFCALDNRYLDKLPSLNQYPEKPGNPDYLPGYDCFNALSDFIGLEKKQNLDEMSEKAVKTLLFSNLYGTIDFTPEGVTYVQDVKDNGTIMNYQVDDQKYSISLKQDGKRAKHHLASLLYKADILLFDEDGKPIMSDGEQKTQAGQGLQDLIVEVPERILLTMELDGEVFATGALAINLNLSENGVDFKKDSAALSFCFDYNGYQVKVGSLTYNAAAGKADASGVVTHNGKEILRATLSADLEFTVSKDTWISDGRPVQNETIMPTKAKNIALDFTLMNQLDARIFCQNVIQTISVMKTGEVFLGRNVSEEKLDKEEWSRKINLFNSLVNMKLYFTGNIAEQASIQMKPAYYFRESEHTYKYAIEPMLRYADGTVFQLVEYAAGLEFSNVLFLVDSFNEMLVRIANNVKEKLI